MKKTYIQPQAAVYKTELSTLIAASLTRGQEEITNSDAILTKEQNDWDIW